jgi:hypothetical protein
MNIVQTCETIEKWIYSCDRIEQLELADEVIGTFLEPGRFKEEKPTTIEMEAHKSMLRDKIEFRKGIIISVQTKTS